MWKYSGFYANDNVLEKLSCNTFSLGIYFISEKKGLNGRKKSAVVYRVKGYVSEKDKALKKAEYLVAKANSIGCEVTKEMFIKWAKEFV